MTSDLVFLVAGGALLLAVVLPGLLHRWAVSAPLVLVAVGMLIGLTPLPDDLPLDPQVNRAAIEHVTEVVVIVALMGVGLALDRPLRPLDPRSWRRWSATWRLLGIGMPLTIAAVALLAWSVGVTPAAALLLGAVLAPTHLVLASDVLYERRNVDLLLDLLPRLTDERSEVLIADPGRPPARAFLEAAARDWRVVTTTSPRSARVSIHRLRRLVR